MERKPLFAANWKMNKLPGEGEAFIRALADKLSGATLSAELMVAPQAPMIVEVGLALSATSLRNCHLGAQNAHWLPSGAHTGESSPELLAKLGVKMVILGHSERRILYREPDREVALRVKSALERGMAAILCVGETKEQFENKDSLSAVLAQLRASLDDVPRDTTSELIIAYEPVWAIGTGLAASPEIAQEMHREIRRELKTLGFSSDTRILYGGSTTPENIAAFMATGEVDGALIGGASLEVGKFASLVLAGVA